jgi:hypothetical protein
MRLNLAHKWRIFGANLAHILAQIFCYRLVWLILKARKFTTQGGPNSRFVFLPNFFS